MAKGKALMSKADRAEMNEGIARMLALKASRVEDQPLKDGEAMFTHNVSLGRYTDKGNGTVSLKQVSGKGLFEVLTRCDTCLSWGPAQLRKMQDGTIRDQPRCPKCRRKMKQAQAEAAKNSEIPF